MLQTHDRSARSALLAASLCFCAVACGNATHSGTAGAGGAADCPAPNVKCYATACCSASDACSPGPTGQGVCASAGGSGGSDGGSGGGSCYTQRVVPARIAVGATTACAIDSSGAAHCWGTPLAGAVPTPSSTVSLLQLSGESVYAAVKSDHSPVFWGGSGAFQGSPPTSSSFDQVVVTSDVIACGITTCGVVDCWPADAKRASSSAPTGVYQQLSAGFAHVCAIDDGQSLKCWGDDTYGQTKAPTGSFKFVTSGDYHSCAVATDGHVECWGAHANSADAGPTAVDFGQAAPPSGTFKYLSGGRLHTCGIKDDDTVACWGLGTTVGDCAGMAECGQAMPPADKFQQIAGGNTNTCGIKLDGSLACWGSNTGGRSTPPTDFK